MQVGRRKGRKTGGGGEGLPRPGLGAGGHKLGVEDGPGVGPSEIVKGFEKRGKNVCYVYRLKNGIHLESGSTQSQVEKENRR